MVAVSSEVAPSSLDGVVLLPDGEEAAVVRLLPVAPGPLALLDDLLDGERCHLECLGKR